MTISECAVALFIVMKRRDGQNKFGPVALSGEVVQHRPAGVEFCPGKKKKKSSQRDHPSSARSAGSAGGRDYRMESSILSQCEPWGLGGELFRGFSDSWAEGVF